MLSLSTAKSGALIGVLISVTTIPAAANIGVAAAYGDRDGWLGSLAQLALNLVSIVVAGTLVLTVQRMLYARRRSARASIAGGETSAAPSDDQTSTFVRTFSTTASVNSLVVAWPPRSIVFVPVATVSSTPS